MAWDKIAEQNKTVHLTPEDYFTEVKEVLELSGLKVVAWGDYGTGKTYLGLSAPEPVYVVDTEFGAAKVAAVHFKNKDIRIFEAKVIDEDTGEADFLKSLEAVENAVTALKDVKEGTIVVDSISDIYTWLNAWVMRTATRKVAASGREYIERLACSARNEKYYLMIMRLLTSPCHVVLTAKEVPVYGERGQELGWKGPRWMAQTPYWCDCVIHIRKVELNPSDLRFYGVIEKLRHKRLVNAKIENVTFDKLCKEIYKQTGLRIRGIAYE